MLYMELEDCSSPNIITKQAMLVDVNQ